MFLFPKPLNSGTNSNREGSNDKHSNSFKESEDFRVESLENLPGYARRNHYQGELMHSPFSYRKAVALG